MRHGGLVGSGAEEECAALKSAILEIKYVWKSMQRERDGTMEGVSRGLVRELNILKRTWGLWELVVTMFEK